MKLEFFEAFTAHIDRKREEDIFKDKKLQEISEFNSEMIKLQEKFDHPYERVVSEDWVFLNTQQKDGESLKVTRFTSDILLKRVLLKDKNYVITDLITFIKNGDFYNCPHFKEFYIRNSVRNSYIDEKDADQLRWNLSYNYEEVLMIETEQKELLKMIITYILYLWYIEESNELGKNLTTVNRMTELLNNSKQYKISGKKKTESLSSSIIYGQSFILRNFLFGVAGECKENHHLETSLKKILYQIKDDQFFSFLTKLIQERGVWGADFEKEWYTYNYWNLRNVISRIHIEQEKLTLRNTLNKLKNFIPFRYMFCGPELFIGFPKMKVFYKWENQLNLFEKENYIMKNPENSKFKNYFAKTAFQMETTEFYAYMYDLIIIALSKNSINTLEHDIIVDCSLRLTTSIPDFSKNDPLYFGGLNFYRDLLNDGKITFNLPLERWVFSWIKQNYFILGFTKRLGSTITPKHNLSHRMRDKVDEFYVRRLKSVVDFKIARDIVSFLEYLNYFHSDIHKKQLMEWFELYTNTFETSLSFTDEKLFKFNKELLNDLLRIGSVLNNKKGFFLFSNMWHADGLPQIFNIDSYRNLIDCSNKYTYSGALLEEKQRLGYKFNQKFNSIKCGSSSFVLSKYDKNLQNFIVYFRRIEIKHIMQYIKDNEYDTVRIPIVRWIEFKDVYPEEKKTVLSYKEIEEGLTKAYRHIPFYLLRTDDTDGLYKKKKYYIEYKYLSLIDTSKNFYILWSIVNDSNPEWLERGEQEYGFKILGKYEAYFELNRNLDLLKLEENKRLSLLDKYLACFKEKYPDIYAYYESIEKEKIKAGETQSENYPEWLTDFFNQIMLKDKNNFLNLEENSHRTLPSESYKSTDSQIMTNMQAELSAKQRAILEHREDREAVITALEEEIEESEKRAEDLRKKIHKIQTGEIIINKKK